MQWTSLPSDWEHVTNVHYRVLCARIIGIVSANPVILIQYLLNLRSTIWGEWLTQKCWITNIVGFAEKLGKVQDSKLNVNVKLSKFGTVFHILAWKIQTLLNFGNIVKNLDLPIFHFGNDVPKFRTETKCKRTFSTL